MDGIREKRTKLPSSLKTCFMQIIGLLPVGTLIVLKISLINRRLLLLKMPSNYTIPGIDIVIKLKRLQKCDTYNPTCLNSSSLNIFIFHDLNPYSSQMQAYANILNLI